jgi:hypothetical protein
MFLSSNLNIASSAFATLFFVLISFLLSFGKEALKCSYFSQALNHLTDSFSLTFKIVVISNSITKLASSGIL